MISAGFVHTVYFWLKEGTTEADKADFEKGLAKLCTIDLIQTGYFGTPAMTPRDVVDNSYGYGLTLLFKDRADQDAYQVHPDHDVFIAAHKHIWERVHVYDYVVK
jgi:hypothetical protein